MRYGCPYMLVSLMKAATCGGVTSVIVRHGVQGF